MGESKGVSVVARLRKCCFALCRPSVCQRPDPAVCEKGVEEEGRDWEGWRGVRLEERVGEEEVGEGKTAEGRDQGFEGLERRIGGEQRFGTRIRDWTRRCCR